MRDDRLTALLQDERNWRYQQSVLLLLKMITRELEEIAGVSTDQHRNVRDKSWKLVDMLEDRLHQLEDALLPPESTSPPD